MKRVFATFYIFIISSLVFLQVVINPLLEKAAGVYFHEGMIQYNREISKGAFHMMKEDLFRYPQEKWKDRIEELKPEFGYEISLLTYDELELKKDQIAQLKSGKIAVEQGGEKLYCQVGQSNWVIMKGPFSQLIPASKIFMIAVYGVLIFSLALITIIWIIPYWRKLKKISNAASRFGKGDFKARAKISQRSSLFPIASAFNTMAERIQQLISSHKELTNAVSHELKTPLSRLRFGIELLASTEDKKKKNHYIQGLYGDINNLEELVGELLTYARFDRETPAIEYQEFPVKQIVDQLIEKLNSSESPRNCRVLLRDDFNNNPKADIKYMPRALANILQNSIRYSQEEILITVSRLDDNCCIDIEDDGPGISKQDREKIFKPFTRLDASRSRSSGGYGLGLAIVEKIMAWHNGTIVVSRAPSGGAKFTIQWPGYQAKGN